MEYGRSNSRDSNSNKSPANLNRRRRKQKELDAAVGLICQSAWSGAPIRPRKKVVPIAGKASKAPKKVLV